MKNFLEFQFINTNFSENFDWAIRIINADEGHKYLINKCMNAVVPEKFLKERFAYVDIFRTEQFSQHAIQTYNTQEAAYDKMELSLEVNGEDFEVHSYEPRDLEKLINAYYLEECNFPNKEYVVKATIRIIVLEHFNRITP